MFPNSKDFQDGFFLPCMLAVGKYTSDSLIPKPFGVTMEVDSRLMAE